MKTLLNCSTIKTSRNFENKVLKLFPKTDKDIYLQSVGMKRRSGYGSYTNFVDFSIGHDTLTLVHHHHDSMGWDDYTGWEDGDRKFQNWAKSTVLYLLAENQQLINDFFFEEEFEANI